MSTQPEKPRPVDLTKLPTLTRRELTRSRWACLRVARQVDNAADILAGIGEGNQAQRLRMLAAEYRKQARTARWF